MLTIKHIDAAGREYIRECESVTWVPDLGDPASFRDAGLYLDRSPDVVSQFHDETGFVIPASRTGSSSDRCSPHVFVMNKHGATIAKYML